MPDPSPEDLTALEELGEQIKGCFEQHSDLDPDQWKKSMWKLISQPSSLSTCIRGQMCKEIGDTSQVGMYRLRICRMPSRAYDVNANQPVFSIEEIVDELTNVCVNLQDGGQLLKHTKTKDSFQLMTSPLKMDELFTFDFSLGFKSMKPKQAPHAEKKLHEENNAFLQQTILGVTDELTHQREKNKYLIVADPVMAAAAQEGGITAKSITEAQEKTAAFMQAAALEQDEERAKESQQSIYARQIDEYDLFVREHTAFWQTVGDYVQRMNDKWGAKLEEFE